MNNWILVIQLLNYWNSRYTPSISPDLDYRLKYHGGAIIIGGTKHVNIFFWHLLRGFPVFIQTLESVWTMSAASNTLASTAMGTWTWNTLDPVDVGAWTRITLVDSGNGVGWTYWTLDSTGSSRTALVPATEVCWTWKTLPSRDSDWGCSVMPWTVSGGGALGMSSTSYAHY